MKTDFLSEQERKDLRSQHRSEKGRRTGDRIKAIIFSDKGWTNSGIADVLLIDEETIRRHIAQYKESQKLSIDHSSGRPPKLTDTQTQELVDHLNAITYTKTADIVVFIQARYGVTFSEHGLAHWLGTHGFVYKKPKKTPRGADPDAQKAFVDKYEKLLNQTPADEPIVFCDAVHPTSETKVSYGWIAKGKNKLIETTASRVRMNIVGALNLETMDVLVKDFDTVNSESIKIFFRALRSRYPNAPKIHVILDNAGYHKTKEIQEETKNLGIELHFLPPRSPNLNPIERLWKVMNERVRNNVSFKNAKEFRKNITGFFTDTWPKIKTTMVDRINDNFEISKKKGPLTLGRFSL
jgi:transposase